MDIEVKPIYNNVSEKKDTNCELEDYSSNEELFEEFQKIIKAKNPQEYKINFKNKYNNNIEKKFKIKKNKQEKKEKKEKQKKIISDEYTSSSGLGDNNIDLKNMYIDNIQKQDVVQNNLNNLLDKNILKQL